MTAQTGNTSAGDAPEWMRRKERGSIFWLRVMGRLSLALGRRLSRLLVYGIALYFVFAAPAARKASRAYLARVLERSITWFDLYRHILAFSSTIHDRFFLIDGQHDLFNIQVFGSAPIYEYRDCNRGLFLFGAHMGSFEMLLTHGRTARLKVCIAMYLENARNINSMLAAINPQALQDIIALRQMGSMLAVHHKLEEGAMVGILADRAVGPDRYISIPFLGAPARFPTGPFRLAAMLKHPVYFMVGLYRGGNRYEIHFELLADFSKSDPANRDAAVREALVKYAAALERHCKSAPYNWFNFYDFWESVYSDTV